MIAPGLHAAVVSALSAPARNASHLPKDKEPVIAVLDTHVVLECFFWRDPVADDLREALLCGTIEPLASKNVLLELAGVASRSGLGGSNERAEALLAEWLPLVRAVPEDELLAAEAMLLERHIFCRDPEDQKFLALAAAGQARLFFTRDRLLAKAAKKLSKAGSAVIRALPEDTGKALCAVSGSDTRSG